MASPPGRIRKAYRVTVREYSDITVYAPNASKARAKVIADVRDAWDCTFREALEKVGRAWRWTAGDVELPQRHPLASSLSREILHCVVHAYGGTGIRAGYRDHFYTCADDPVLRGALYHCLFEVVRKDRGRNGRSDMIMYALTDFGKNVARGEVKTYPEHE